MAGIKQTLIGILLAGVFAFAIIMAGGLLAEHNQANHSITDSPSLQAFKTNLNNTLLQAEENSNKSLTSLGDSPLSEVSGGLVIFTAIAGVWKTLKEVPVGIYNLITGEAKTHLFGSGFNVVFGVITAIMIIILILGIIKLVTTGLDE